MSILKDYYEENNNIKNELQEFLKELKHNQNINLQKDIENVVDIQYLIKRITDILEA